MLANQYRAPWQEKHPHVDDLVRLLDRHRSSIRRTETGWERMYPYQDLDICEYPQKEALR